VRAPTRRRRLRRLSRHTPRDAAERRLLREEIARLRRSPSGPGAALLAHALTQTLRRSVDAPARDWFDRIEAQRDRLVADDRELSGGRGTTSTVGAVTRKASVPRHQAALLFHLARATGAERCLEMGTCVGISGSYLGAAMELRGSGVLRSLEGYEDRASVARDTFARLGFGDAEVVVGRFHRTLAPTLETGPFDLVFIDGHHDGGATVAYTELIRRASRPGTVLVLDDISWSPGMRTAWEQIATRLRGSTCCDLRRFGLVVVGPEDAGRDRGA
jgi:predicted O-methyltransferase YrrM